MGQDQNPDNNTSTTPPSSSTWLKVFFHKLRKTSIKTYFLASIALGVSVAMTTLCFVLYLYFTLPSLEPIKNYNPNKVSLVFDRNGKVIDSFFKQKRVLTPLDEVPEHTMNAFIAAEDAAFYTHSGMNIQAIFRAALANIAAGRKVQGASTITQQVAKTLVLSSQKTYTRKIRELFLAHKMEKLLSKKDILFLYLNQIYLGSGAYGVGQAAQTYFNKHISELTLAESALLAGLPQAPARYSPSSNPQAAKKRQRYALKQMLKLNYITSEQMQEALDTPLSIYPYIPPKRQAPYVKSLIKKTVEKIFKDQDIDLLEDGLKVYTTFDLEKQLSALEALQKGLKEVDKRQGYRGPITNFSSQEEIQNFAQESFQKLKKQVKQKRLLLASGDFPEEQGYGPLKETKILELPPYLQKNMITEGIVLQVEDSVGLVKVQVADYEGLIDIDSMTWARTPNPIKFYKLDEISKPSKALREGDVILVKIADKHFQSKRLKKTPEGYRSFNSYLHLELEQKPLVQGGLLSLSPENDEVLALVGGFSFAESQFNRVLQAKRQTGSTFKPIVYLAALDFGLLPNSKILDTPIAFSQEDEKSVNEDTTEPDIFSDDKTPPEESQQFDSRWKPRNSSGKFSGQILLRDALVQSKNIPTIKIVNKMGVSWIKNYAQRMGITSQLNEDLTLGLGSSALSLYEMTKSFAQIARLGKKSNPIFITSIQNTEGDILHEAVAMDFAYGGTNPEAELQQSILKEAHKKLRELELIIQNDPTQAIPKKIQITHPQTGESIFIDTKNIPSYFFSDPDQLFSPQTAYVLISMLKGVIDDPRGSGRRALSLNRPAFGKTGTTNGYFDAWFLGSTKQITTGVWVGFDNEKSLGRGEVGGRAALPIWLKYMKESHKGLPKEDFFIPPKIVITNLDGNTGLLPSPQSTTVFEQAFVEGSEPNEVGETTSSEEESFLKEGL